jgi:alpha-ribazole phosphatase
MQTRVILIRHGETDWNFQRRYLSFSDIDINATGRKQISSAQANLEGESVEKVYASDRKRALTSAGLLFKGLNIEASMDLREMDFGMFEGLRYEDIKEKYKDIYDAWILDPRKTTIPDGEAFAAFESRVMNKLRLITQDNLGTTVAVVTHGGVIRLILSNVLKASKFWDVKMVKPASVTIIEGNKDCVFNIIRYEPEGDIWPK